MVGCMELRQEFKVYKPQQVTRVKLHARSENQLLEDCLSFYIICYMLDLGISAGHAESISNRPLLHSAHSADSYPSLHL